MAPLVLYSDGSAQCMDCTRCQQHFARYYASRIYPEGYSPSSVVAQERDADSVCGKVVPPRVGKVELQAIDGALHAAQQRSGSVTDPEACSRIADIVQLHHDCVNDAQKYPRWHCCGQLLWRRLCPSRHDEVGLRVHCRVHQCRRMHYSTLIVCKRFPRPDVPFRWQRAGQQSPQMQAWRDGRS